jgi:hypothetical protein
VASEFALIKTVVFIFACISILAVVAVATRMKLGLDNKESRLDEYSGPFFIIMIAITVVVFGYGKEIYPLKAVVFVFNPENQTINIKLDNKHYAVAPLSYKKLKGYSFSNNRTFALSSDSGFAQEVEKGVWLVNLSGDKPVYYYHMQFVETTPKIKDGTYEEKMLRKRFIEVLKNHAAEFGAGVPYELTSDPVNICEDALSRDVTLYAIGEAAPEDETRPEINIRYGFKSIR